MADDGNIALNLSYHKQLIDRMRLTIYNNELRFNLLVKMLEEKGILANQELEKRWPLYLKNDIGAMGSDRIMSGSLKVTFYNEN